MKVFISWSGERSRQVAEMLDDWIQCVLQAVDPWMSNEDIDRGALWFTDIGDQLSDTRIGIVCLTHENKEKPWILFEAGAIAKGLSSSRVCTFLIDLKPTDIRDPLAQFNHTLPEKPEVLKLVRTINRALGENSLKDNILEKVFNTYWPQFEEKFEEILKLTETNNPIPSRSEESLLTEILDSIRRIDHRVRGIEQFNVSSNHYFDTIKDTPRASISSQIELKIIVRDMIEEGIDLALIKNFLRQEGLSERSVQRMVNEVINSLPSQNTDS